MGMQIATSMTIGSGSPAVSQEATRGRRISSPIEQNADSGRTEMAMPRPEPIDLNQTTTELAQINNAFDRRLQFVLDQESSDITVKVIDRKTDTVIKVLPPEELQRLNSGIKDASGVLFDRTV